MSTSPTLYLEFEKSKRRLDLTSDRYRIGSKFQPPTVVSNVALASGTSANTVGRSRVIGRSPQPTEFTFLEQIWGASAKEVDRALADLQSFVAWAGDDSDPLCLVYKSNSDTPEPIFGQDGSVRYRIMKGEVTPGEDYSVRPSREAHVRDNQISLLLQPYALGRRQKLASATGAISVRRASSDSSEIVGVSVPYPTTNLFHNPIFAHPTWNNKWSAAAGVVGFVNKDKRFVFTGESSLYLVAQPTGSRVWYQAHTLSATTHCGSFYVKLVDSGVVNSSICQVYFNNALQTSIYTSVGDGWYRVSFAGTASASSANYGIGLAAGASAYFDGIQLEANGYATPLAHADALGCAPSGGYHDSTTTRATGRIKIPAAKNHRLLGSGTISAIVTLPSAGVYGSNFWVFQESTTAFSLYWEYALTRWVFGDGTSGVVSSDTLSSAKRIHFHCVYGQNGISLYINGALIGTTTYTPASAINDMYLLTSASPLGHQDHYLSEYVVWGEALTASQIASDYQSKLTLTGQATSIPPIFWTKDGDDGLDNANDSTRDNFGVALFVPGSAPALTRFSLNGVVSGETYTLGNWELSEFIRPDRVLYYEQSGTVDASCSGGQYKRTSISTTELQTSVDFTKWEQASDSSLLRFVKGRRFSCVVRMRNPSSGYLRWRHVLSNLMKQQPQRIAGGSTYWRNFVLPALVIPDTDSEIYQIGDQIDTLVVNPGGAVNVDCDYVFMMPHPSFSFFASTVVIEGREYDGYYGVSAQSVSGVVTGGEINLRPDTYNVICMSAFGTMAGLGDNSIDTGLTFSTIEIQPRWELLQ